MTAITIDLHKPCAECSKPGATATGLCLSCTTRAISDAPMVSAIGRAVQLRIHKFMGERNEI